MRVLLATCALIWLLRDDPELSELAAELIEDERNEAFVSVASIWEIAIKSSIGKLSRPEGLETSLEVQLLESGFSIWWSFGGAADLMGKLKQVSQ